MTPKPQSDQASARRSPRQARSQHKVGLMLEAALQLLASGDVDSLTTNAVAAKAGVSVGTLYQYFQDKHALLDALAERELAAMSEQALQALQASPTVPGERIRRVVRASLGTYGGNSRVHRRLIEHALTHTGGERLSPLYAHLRQAFVSEGVAVPGEAPLRLSEAQAFVLTHALAGVLRTLAASDAPPPLGEVEDALVMLALSFVGSARRAAIG